MTVAFAGGMSFHPEGNGAKFADAKSTNWSPGSEIRSVEIASAAVNLLLLISCQLDASFVWFIRVFIKLS